MATTPSTSLPPHYQPAAAEQRWYAHWLEKNYFHSEPDEREPFTIVIPPPNVTGVLHMGHMLNNTIQDILIRKARLEGKNACWVPGTDHASIATEAKVVKRLRAQNIKKSDLTRAEFLDHAFRWKEEYGGKILEQLKRLGASCDWQRTRFTMEESMSEAVVKVFVDLHKKGRLYRGLRMTNWDPEAQTVLSNEEVIYTEENTALYYVKYPIEDSEEFITIATVRPETIMGDSAIAVNPDDERFAHLRGKRAIVPLVNRSIPIIEDDYVEIDFGTGALKITPAHDPNDNEIGERHGLEVINILNADGTLNEAAQVHVGLDRFEARKAVVRDLKESGHWVKTETYRNKVGRSERTNSVVEPRLTLQWFLKMDQFAKSALEAVQREEVNFFPPHFQNMYRNWLAEDNVRDWCISRQLWWGQQIPAWYHGEEVFVAATEAEAVAQAREKLDRPELTAADLTRDDDVVDTWFSSWLWPISVFDGFKDPTELKYYYPTNVLVTGWDIMFFWVARMVMAGYEWAPELLGKDHPPMPFHDVYFTGMVRDEKRRKMSKSLGNSPDALALIDTYGADGVRFGMLSSGAAGNDIIFDAPIDAETKQVLNQSQLCEQGRNFCNKMWNALRLIKGWEVVDAPVSDEVARVNHLAGDWLEAKLAELVATTTQNIAEYRLSEALINTYKFIWGDFCSWYLEMIKPAYQAPIDRPTLERTLELYSRMMTVLHPFMPFITEEIWHHLKARAAGEDCVVSSYPAVAAYDAAFLARIEQLKDIVTKVRDARNTAGMKMKEELTLSVTDTDAARALFATPGTAEALVKMANLRQLDYVSAEPAGTIGFISGTEQFYLESTQRIDVAAERERIEGELEHARGFVKIVEKKLGNERFVANAPAAVVDKERQKLADGRARVRILEESLAKLVG